MRTDPTAPDLSAPPDLGVPSPFDADPEALRALGHRLVDEAVDGLATLRDRPVWRPTPAASRAAFAGPFPEEGATAKALCDIVREHVQPHVLGTTHPRWWGYVAGGGALIGAYGDFLAALLAAPALGGDQASTWMELQVLRWMGDLVGFPPEAAGVLVTGCSAAMIVALQAALGQRAGPGPHVVYVSDQAHYSVRKAVELIGAQRARVEVVPSDEAFRLPADALERRIADTRAAGAAPAVVVGSLGTVDTGAIDALPALADVCDAHGLWLHVDGAIGAPLACSERLAPLAAGVERADSVAFDLHKWMQVPFSVGGVLVRTEAALTSAFRSDAAYVVHFERGISAGGPTFRDRSFDLSRPFTALKVWMTLSSVGRRAYGTLFEQSVALARHLGNLVDAAPAFERLAPVSLHTVCFRFVGEGNTSEDTLEPLNTELLLRIQEDGTCMLTPTRVRGAFALRACFSNHRTRREDVDLAMARIQHLAADVARGSGVFRTPL